MTSSLALLLTLATSLAMSEGTVGAGIGPNQMGWTSGIVVLNPADIPVMIHLSLQDDDVVEEQSIEIPPHGVKTLRSGKASLIFTATHDLFVFGYDVNVRSGARYYRPAAPSPGLRKRRAVRVPSNVPGPQTVVLTPAKDNTLYQSTDGSLSNGAGIHVFAGSTGGRALRRALVAFDIGSQIPPGSRIQRAVLELHVSQTISGAETVALHRLTADWGEGPSDAGSARDGIGGSSGPGDATWIHTFFPDRFWTTQGGDFATTFDSSSSIGAVGDSTWESAAMSATVQSWLDQPASNFGWIVIGNESRNSTAKRFDSREVSSETTRPSLTIEFVRP
jgi:hypothetical protein